MWLDVRLLVVVAVVVLIVCLAVGFARIALAIRRDYESRFSRIRQHLEESATSLLASLLHRER